MQNTNSFFILNSLKSRHFIFFIVILVRVGRDLWRSSCPTLLPRQGDLQQFTQDLVQAGFECLQTDSTAPLGSLSQCSSSLNGYLLSPCGGGTSCGLVYCHCSSPCCWAALKRVWHHPPDTQNHTLILFFVFKGLWWWLDVTCLQ